MKMQKQIVIVGGGITGLAAAYQAVVSEAGQQDPPSVVVLEASDRFGGKVKSHQTTDFSVEAGPDSIFTRKPGGVELIEELGLGSEVIGSPQMKTGILRHDRLFELPPGMTFGLPTKLSTFAFNSLIPLSGKVRGLADFFLPRDETAADKSVGALLRRRIGDDLVNILAEPMLAGVYAGSIDRLSVNTVAPYLAKMEQENGSLIRAMLKQGKQSAKPSPGKPASPSFVSFPNGLQQLVDTLTSKLRAYPTVDLQTQTRVRHVDKRADGGFLVSCTDAAGQAKQLAADAVLLCVPAFAARPLVPAAGDVYDWLTEIPYVSTAAVSLVFPVPAASVSLPFTGFLVPRGEDAMLTACTVISSKWPATVKNGAFVVRGYVGRDGEEETLERTDEDFIRHMQRRIAQFFRVTADPVWTAVDRWPRAMPQYVVGHGERLRSLRARIAADLPGMYLAGAGYGGMGIPDCIRQGRQAMNDALVYLRDRAHACAQV